MAELTTGIKVSFTGQSLGELTFTFKDAVGAEQLGSGLARPPVLGDSITEQT